MTSGERKRLGLVGEYTACLREYPSVRLYV